MFRGITMPKCTKPYTARKEVREMKLYDDYNAAIKKPEQERSEAEKALIAKIEEIRQAEIARLGKKE